MFLEQTYFLIVFLLLLQIYYVTFSIFDYLLYTMLLIELFIL